MRLLWTVAALSDLRAIADFIGRDNRVAASQQVNIIRTAAMTLTRFPEAGRIGQHAGSRELIVPRSPYILAYRIDAGTVQVLRVLHGHQRWPDRL